MNTKATERKLKVKNFIPDALFLPPEFVRVEKIHFDAIIKEAAKTAAIKSQVDNILDIALKNR